MPIHKNSKLAGILKNTLIIVLTGIFLYLFTQSGLLHRVLIFFDSENPSKHGDTVTEKFDYSFNIKDLNDNRIGFENFRGKVIFLNLWATWCAPCRAEMPSIEKLYLENQRDEIQFIMLSLDEDSDLQKVKNFIHSRNFTFPVFMPSGHLPAQLQVPGIPTTFIIDKQGKIIMKKVGMTNFSNGHYDKLLKELANQNP
jgi:thiol-disulfide isomerase/thioredoxin